jgi:hypothetical protein
MLLTNRPSWDVGPRCCSRCVEAPWVSTAFRDARRASYARHGTRTSWAHGCRRLMAPLVPLFARTTFSPACAMRVERRRLPPKPPLPLKTCAQCQQPFRPGRRGTGKVEVRFCSARCRTRARDDRKVAAARAARPKSRHCACGRVFTPTRITHVACSHRCSQRLRKDDRRLALTRANIHSSWPCLLVSSLGAALKVV